MSSSDDDDFGCYTNTAAVLAKAYSTAKSKSNVPMQTILAEFTTGKCHSPCEIDINKLSDNEDGNISQKISPKKRKKENSKDLIIIESPKAIVNEQEIIGLDEEVIDNDCEIVQMSDSANDISGVLAKIDECMETSQKRKRKTSKRGCGKQSNTPRNKKAVTQPRRRSNRRGRWWQQNYDDEDNNLLPLFAKEKTLSNLDVAKEGCSTETKIDEVNPKLTVKVWWRLNKIDKFEIRKYQKLDSIFEFYAKQENVTEDRLLFTLKEKFVSKDDTPDSLALETSSIIEGGISTKSINLNSVQSLENKKEFTEQLNFKIQQKDSKKPLIIGIKKSDIMATLLAKVAEEIKMPTEHFQLSFDGDAIKPQMKPEDLELEGDECLDLIILR